MPLDTFNARHYAEACLLVPGFPNDEVALDWLARFIMQECADSTEADAFVTRICYEFDRWPGVGSVAAILRSMKEPARTEQREYRGFSRPTDLCPACASNGVLQLDSGEAFERCPCCRNGAEFPQNLLDMLNATPPPPRRHSTEDRIRRAIAFDQMIRTSESYGRG
jgi:hypothetical protein